MAQEVYLGLKSVPLQSTLLPTSQTLDINVVHEMFGHPNAQVLAATAAKYGFHTKNDLHFCSNCAIREEKHTNLHKLTAHPSTELGGSINIDISSVQNTIYEGANVWLLIQDNFTGYFWTYFIKAKSDLPETMLDWIKLDQNEINLNAKSIRLDNSG
jgi:hypothetical protein